VIPKIEFEMCFWLQW